MTVRTAVTARLAENSSVALNGIDHFAGDLGAMTERLRCGYLLFFLMRGRTDF